MMLLLVLSAQQISIFIKKNASQHAQKDTTRTLLLDGVLNADVIVRLAQAMMFVLHALEFHP